MTKIEGLQEIEDAKWIKDEYGVFILNVRSERGFPIYAQLSLRPAYCDRGHFQLLIVGDIELDEADMFPRFFFSPKEADHHVRCFFRWRLWKERTYEHSLDVLT